MKRLAVLLTFLFVFSISKAQKNLFNLKNKLLSADSVILVSHDDTNAYMIDSTGKRIPPPRLVVNGKPNQEIIHERKTLADTAVKRLAKILVQPNRTRIIETGKCYMPHHAIFLYRKGKLSFVNICFGCEGLDTSKDVALSEADFYPKKWEELYNFFIQSGLKYELVF